MIKNSFVLSLVLLVEGGSLMAVELMGAKFLAPFYGTSLYVWTAILAITSLGLSLGYYVGGKLAKNEISEKHLFAIITTSAVLVLAFPYSSHFLINLTSNLDLIPGICLTALTFILPPMFCFGMVGPIIVKLTAKEILSVGKKAGGIYFTSTMGGIIATFLFGFYGIPFWGLKVCSLITAIALFLLPLFYFLFSLISKKNYLKNIVKNPESQIKKQTRIYNSTKHHIPSALIYVVLEGAIVMAIEIMAARMIAPFFGSSLYVWCTVIGITLLSLALGYYIGGWVGDKYSGINSIRWSMLIAAVFMLFMHVISKQMTLALFEYDSRYTVILITLMMIFPPLLFLGMIPTLLIKYLSQKIESAGSNTGKVYTISSASGIFSLFIIGFIIIPNYGLTMPSIIIGIAAGILPFIKLISQKKYASLLFLFCITISLFFKGTEKSTKDIQVQYASEGLLGQIIVADQDSIIVEKKKIPVNDRILFINRMGQTFINKTTGVPKWNYMLFSSTLMSKIPENSTALLLGLGGGSLANLMINLKFNVDAVELDERIARVATDYFGLSNNVNVIIDDARHYIETTDKKYDLIYLDLFKGEAMPSNVLTIESFRKVKELLNQNGIVIVNFNGYLNNEIGKSGRSIFNTLEVSGFNTKILPTPGTESERNNLFVAGKSTFDFHTVRSPLLFKGSAVNIDSMFLDTKNINLKNAVILTDDKPILEKMNMDAADAWRKGYNKTYIKLFSESGVPMFQ